MLHPHYTLPVARPYCVPQDNRYTLLHNTRWPWQQSTKDHNGTHQNSDGLCKINVTDSYSNSPILQQQITFTYKNSNPQPLTHFITKSFVFDCSFSSFRSMHSLHQKNELRLLLSFLFLFKNAHPLNLAPILKITPHFHFTHNVQQKKKQNNTFMRIISEQVMSPRSKHSL